MERRGPQCGKGACAEVITQAKMLRAVPEASARLRGARRSTLDHQRVFAALICASVLWLSSISPPRAETGSACRVDHHQNHSFVVCEFDPRHYDLKLFWKKPNGEIYGAFQNIPHRQQSNKGVLVFATNGGMYRPNRSPVGLYI